MKTLAMLAAILPVVVQAAPPGWTDAQWAGIEKTLSQVQQLLDKGDKPTKTRPTKLTIGGNVGRSAFCLRTSLLLDAAQIAKFGIDPALVPTTASRYAVVTVCGAPTSQKSNRTPLLDLAVDSTISAPFSSDPGQDAFQIALRDDTEAQAASTGFGCVCATGPQCSWTRGTPEGGTVSGPCPRPLTLPASQVMGADIVRTPCVGIAGSDPIAPACVP